MERKITIEEDKIYREDYQLRMLQANRIEGLLDVKGRGVDEKSCYDYDVSGKVSLRALYEKNEIGAEEIKKFLKRLLLVMEETEKYLLNIHCLLLKPEYIYYEAGEYYFCYFPPGTDGLWGAFHKLTEYFVKRADYKDQVCVQMIFLLHKETMEENYSLQKLAVKCLSQMEEKTNMKNDGGAGEEYKSKEDWIDDRKEKQIEDQKKGNLYGERDWIGEQEMGNAVREEGDFMRPVKRFFGRRKKPKWGDWDGLYIEEEEL